MAATVVIPARFASTRFPAKMLASETGRPLVQHVVDRVRGCQNVSEIIVATDDARIREALKPFGTKVVLTDPAHTSGTDRVAEAAEKITSDIIVNVQGDEPEIDASVVERLVDVIEEYACNMATAAAPFPEGADAADPNLVKVVVGRDGRALYFSRAAIPHYRDADSSVRQAYYLHVGIYAYQRDFLKKFTGWSPTSLEKAEKLEQLRALEHEERIQVLRISRASHGIDTPQQYAAFVKRFKERQQELP